MHAWICENPTGVDDLLWKELPTPEPGPGEVRLAVRAASLNFRSAALLEADMMLALSIADAIQPAGCVMVPDAGDNAVSVMTAAAA